MVTSRLRPTCGLILLGDERDATLQSVWLGLRLFTFGLSKPHLDCLGTTITPPSNLKFYFLSFSKGPVFHPLKLAAMKEEVFSYLSFDESKSSVCN
jgi:hypothetical protein